MSKKTYIVESYDPATRKIERVTVTHEVYNAYRRSGWNIADNNQSFFKHEIQMSSLIGGEDGGYDNFREFIGDPEAVDNAVAERMPRPRRGAAAAADLLRRAVFRPEP